MNEVNKLKIRLVISRMKRTLKRHFQKSWFEQYSWLVYSPKLKGGLFKFCTLFKPVLKRGTFGAFVIKAHQDYKHFHEDARGHEKSSWHLKPRARQQAFVNRLN